MQYHYIQRLERERASLRADQGCADNATKEVRPPTPKRLKPEISLCTGDSELAALFQCNWDCFGVSSASSVIYTPLDHLEALGLTPTCSSLESFTADIIANSKPQGHASGCQQAARRRVQEPGVFSLTHEIDSQWSSQASLSSGIPRTLQVTLNNRKTCDHGELGSDGLQNDSTTSSTPVRQTCKSLSSDLRGKAWSLCLFPDGASLPLGDSVTNVSGTVATRSSGATETCVGLERVAEVFEDGRPEEMRADKRPEPHLAEHRTKPQSGREYPSSVSNKARSPSCGRKKAGFSLDDVTPRQSVCHPRRADSAATCESAKGVGIQDHFRVHEPKSGSSICRTTITEGPPCSSSGSAAPSSKPRVGERRGTPLPRSRRNAAVRTPGSRGAEAHVSPADTRGDEATDLSSTVSRRLPSEQGNQEIQQVSICRADDTLYLMQGGQSPHCPPDAPPPSSACSSSGKLFTSAVSKFSTRSPLATPSAVFTPPSSCRRTVSIPTNSVKLSFRSPASESPLVHKRLSAVCNLSNGDTTGSYPRKPPLRTPKREKCLDATHAPCMGPQAPDALRSPAQSRPKEQRSRIPQRTQGRNAGRVDDCSEHEGIHGAEAGGRSRLSGTCPPQLYPDAVASLCPAFPSHLSGRIPPLKEHQTPLFDYSNVGSEGNEGAVSSKRTHRYSTSPPKHATEIKEAKSSSARDSSSAETNFHMTFGNATHVIENSLPPPSPHMKTANPRHITALSARSTAESGGLLRQLPTNAAMGLPRLQSDTAVLTARTSPPGVPAGPHWGRLSSTNGVAGKSTNRKPSGQCELRGRESCSSAASDACVRVQPLTSIVGGVAHTCEYQSLSGQRCVCHTKSASCVGIGSTSRVYNRRGETRKPPIPLTSPVRLAVVHLSVPNTWASTREASSSAANLSRRASQRDSTIRASSVLGVSHRTVDSSGSTTIGTRSHFQRQWPHTSSAKGGIRTMGGTSMPTPDPLPAAPHEACQSPSLKMSPASKRGSHRVVSGVTQGVVDPSCICAAGAVSRGRGRGTKRTKELKYDSDFSSGPNLTTSGAICDVADEMSDSNAAPGAASHLSLRCSGHKIDRTKPKTTTSPPPRNENIGGKAHSSPKCNSVKQKTCSEMLSNKTKCRTETSSAAVSSALLIDIVEVVPAEQRGQLPSQRTGTKWQMTYGDDVVCFPFSSLFRTVQNAGGT